MCGEVAQGFIYRVSAAGVVLMVCYCKYLPLLFSLQSPKTTRFSMIVEAVDGRAVRRLSAPRRSLLCEFQSLRTVFQIEALVNI